MKFIGQIHNKKLENNGLVIDLPRYHRTATASLSGTKLYTYPRRINVKSDITGEDEEVIEIVLTQFPPYRWEELWKLTVRLNDKPGITEKFTRVIRDLGINIYNQESFLTNSEQTFNITLIGDFEDSAIEKGTNDEETQKIYYTRIFEELKSEKAFLEVEFEIDSLKFLHKNSKKYDKSSGNLVPAQILKGYRRWNRRPNEVNEGKITLKKILDDSGVLQRFQSNPIRFTVLSDTEEKYILVRFFRMDQYVIHLDIKHDNNVGSIHKFSEVIVNTSKKFNILNSYNRVEDFSATSHWYVMLDCYEEADNFWILKRRLEEQDVTKEVRVIGRTDNFREKLEKMGVQVFEPEKEGREVRIRDLQEKVEILGNEKEQTRKKGMRYRLERNVALFVISLYLVIQLALYLIDQYWEFQQIDEAIRQDGIYIEIGSILIGAIYFVVKQMRKRKSKEANL